MLDQCTFCAPTGDYYSSISLVPFKNNTREQERERLLALAHMLAFGIIADNK